MLPVFRECTFVVNLFGKSHHVSVELLDCLALQFNVQKQKSAEEWALA